MNSDWIDSKAYFGFCRRSRGDRFRLTNRRRENIAAEPPSMAAMIRRLRVRAFSVDTVEGRLNFLSHLNAAIDLADRRGARSCYSALDDLARLVSGPAGSANSAGSEVDRRLAEIDPHR